MRAGLVIGQGQQLVVCGVTTSGLVNHLVLLCRCQIKKGQTTDNHFVEVEVRSGVAAIIAP